MKKIIAISSLLLFSSLTGCASLQNSVQRGVTQWTGDDYRITLYSGNDAVRVWEVRGQVIHSEQGSDGWYWNCGGHMIQIAGAVVVEPLTTPNTSGLTPVVCQ